MSTGSALRVTFEFGKQLGVGEIAEQNVRRRESRHWRKAKATSMQSTTSPKVRTSAPSTSLNKTHSRTRFIAGGKGVEIY